MAVHIPVLLKPCLEYLITRPEGVYLDMTTGEGGHSRAIAVRLKGEGKLLCFDRDTEIQRIAKTNLAEFKNISFILDNFAHIRENLKRLNIRWATGILADLGLSMFHYRESSKGFSFLRNDPLDMSLEGTSPNAREVINRFSKQEIADILYQYGEERASRRIASFIVAYRKEKPIETTAELAEIIRKAVPRPKKPGFHPATKSFQALRIFVNREMENLKQMLEEGIEALKPGGRIAIITYHSLEDRIVKWFFRQRAAEKEIKILTKKPIIPGREEILSNPSSRSAKLRLAEKL